MSTFSPNHMPTICVNVSCRVTFNYELMNHLKDRPIFNSKRRNLTKKVEQFPSLDITVRF